MLISLLLLITCTGCRSVQIATSRKIYPLAAPMKQEIPITLAKGITAIAAAVPRASGTKTAENAYSEQFLHFLIPHIVLLTALHSSPFSVSIVSDDYWQIQLEASIE